MNTRHMSTMPHSVCMSASGAAKDSEGQILSIDRTLSFLHTYFHKSLGVGDEAPVDHNKVSGKPKIAQKVRHKSWRRALSSPFCWPFSTNATFVQTVWWHAPPAGQDLHDFIVILFAEPFYLFFFNWEGEYCSAWISPPIPPPPKKKIPPCIFEYCSRNIYLILHTIIHPRNY